jgi:formamidopyrimidine-DNA glycosylase
MPELPEVENVVRGLRPFLVGRRFSSVEVLNPAIIKMGAERFEDAVSGSCISSIIRRGKYIVLDLQGGQFLVFHLGMTGRLYFSVPSEPREKHTHVVFAIDSMPRELRHVDSRRFGGAYLCHGPEFEQFKRLHRLGPEPLDLNFNCFAQLIKNRRARIKALLLDQATLAGLGNIYCDESLHRAGIHPCRLASGLNSKELRGLFLQIQRVLRHAIDQGGSSISDYVDAEGSRGQYQNHYRVYGRNGEPCKAKNCHGFIRRIQVAGRSSHFCPLCQRWRGRRPSLQPLRPAGRNRT